MFDTDIASESKDFFVAPRLADLLHRETGCRSSCHSQGRHKADPLQPTSCGPHTIWPPLSSPDCN